MAISGFLITKKKSINKCNKNKMIHYYSDCWLVVDWNVQWEIVRRGHSIKQKKRLQDKHCLFYRLSIFFFHELHDYQVRKSLFHLRYLSQSIPLAQSNFLLNYDLVL